MVLVGLYAKPERFGDLSSSSRVCFGRRWQVIQQRLDKFDSLPIVEREETYCCIYKF